MAPSMGFPPISSPSTPTPHLPQAGTRTPVLTAAPCPSRSGFAVDRQIGGGDGSRWVGVPWRSHLPCPVHCMLPTFLVLYSDRQMETVEMRKMHRAYQ